MDIRCRDKLKGTVVVVWVDSPRGFTTVCEIEVFGSGRYTKTLYVKAIELI